ITVHDSMAELSRRSQDLTGRFDHVQRTLEQTEDALGRSIAAVDHSIAELRGESVSRLEDIRADSRSLAAAAGDLRALGDDNTKALSYALEHLNNLTGYIG